MNRAEEHENYHNSKFIEGGEVANMRKSPGFVFIQYVDATFHSPTKSSLRIPRILMLEMCPLYSNHVNS